MTVSTRSRLHGGQVEDAQTCQRLTFTLCEQNWVRPILHPEPLSVKHQSDSRLTSFAMPVAIG